MIAIAVLTLALALIVLLKGKVWTGLVGMFITPLLFIGAIRLSRPHAPWERGANENTNGLIREYFPKGTDFGKVTKAQVDRMTRSMNNRPRRCLGYQTPHEVFEKLAGVALQI